MKTYTDREIIEVLRQEKRRLVKRMNQSIKKNGFVRNGWDYLDFLTERITTLKTRLNRPLPVMYVEWKFNPEEYVNRDQ